MLTDIGNRPVENEDTKMETDPVPVPVAPSASLPSQTPTFQVLRVLGEGAYGEVKLVVDAKNPQLAVAMKCMDLNKYKDNERVLQAFRKEALIQKRLSNKGHENLIRYIGMRIDEALNEFQIFLEYADGGELFDRIEPDVGVKPAKAQFYFRQLCAGLSFIHEQGIAHRDIKPENLLLTKSELLKISDFGMATIFKHQGVERHLDSCCGTLPYASPEVLRGRYRGEPADIWSCGVVLVTLLAGELPWASPSNDCEAFTAWIQKRDFDRNPWKKIDNKALSLLSIILNNDEEERANMERVKNHPWFKADMSGADRPSKKRRVDDGVSQPANRLRVPIEMAACHVSFSQPENIRDLLISQTEASQDMDPLSRLTPRMTRFCVACDLSVLVGRIHRACEQLIYEVKEKPPNQLLVVVAEQHMEMSFVVGLVEMKSLGRNVVMVDCRRSRGDGLQFKRAFKNLRAELSDLVCPRGTNWLQLNKLTITDE